MSCISSLQVFRNHFLIISSSSFPQLLISSDWKLKSREVSGSLSVPSARKAVRSEAGSGVRVPGGAAQRQQRLLPALGQH